MANDKNTAQATQNTLNMANFFDKKEDRTESINILGFEHYVMDSGTILRVYEVLPALADDTQKFGIIPSTISVDPNLLDALKRVPKWPAILEVQIMEKPGAKGSKKHITAIKSGAL